MEPRWWLETEDGVRRRLDAGGVTLGRSPRCDVVLSSAAASRVHALAHLAPKGPRCVQLGRGATRVNGERVEGARDLASGDTIEVPGLVLTVVSEDASRAGIDLQSAWVVERTDGGLFGISRTPFQIGGSADDDLRVQGWADHAVVLSSIEGALHVQASAPVIVDGAPLAPGASRVIGRGGTIEHEGERFTVVTGGALGQASTLGASAEVPSPRTARVELEFLPKGGRLFVRHGGGESAVYLPDRRCDLVAILLSPPEPLQPGDFVSDDVVLARVWGKEPRDRTDLNVLVYRLRKDLTRAGLDGSTLIERASGGGATRFALEPDTSIELT